MEELIARCDRMIKELGIPVTVFCNKVGIGVSTFYALRSGKPVLSINNAQKLEEYIKKYNF